LAVATIEVGQLDVIISIVVAFAASQDRWPITHDRGCARNALGRAFPTLGLWAPETDDAERQRA